MKDLLFKTSGLGIAFGLMAIAPAALAQSAPNAADLLDNHSEPQSGEVFSGSGVDFGDLVHRANQAGGMTADEYRERQQRNFDEATTNYLQRQQEILQQQPVPNTNSDSLEIGF